MNVQIRYIASDDQFRVEITETVSGDMSNFVLEPMETVLLAGLLASAENFRDQGVDLTCHLGGTPFDREPVA